MREIFTQFTRRRTLAALGGVSTLALLPAAARAASDAPPTGGPIAGLDPDAALDRIAYRMLAHEPGRATGAGVDTGEYAAWRSTFGTPGEAGRQAYAASLKEMVAEVRAFPKDGLTSDQQIGFEVVETAFSRAIEGMAMPYGDVAVGSWRNAPYVVIQNVGGYIDMPRFFSSTQPLATADDVGPYLDRLIEVLELQPQVGAVSGRVVNASDGADQGAHRACGRTHYRASDRACNRASAFTDAVILLDRHVHAPCVSSGGAGGSVADGSQNARRDVRNE